MNHIDSVVTLPVIRSFLMVAVSQETRKEDRKKYTTAAARWYLR
jgi:hypothetical protein